MTHMTPSEELRDLADAIETGNELSITTHGLELLRRVARDLEVQHEVIKAQRAEIDQWETDHHELIAEC